MSQQECGELYRRLSNALIEFVERAVKSGATPGEVEALPGVAETLRRLISP